MIETYKFPKKDAEKLAALIERFNKVWEPGEAEQAKAAQVRGEARESLAAADELEAGHPRDLAKIGEALARRRSAELIDQEAKEISRAAGDLDAKAEQEMRDICGEMRSMAQVTFEWYRHSIERSFLAIYGDQAKARVEAQGAPLMAFFATWLNGHSGYPKDPDSYFQTVGAELECFAKTGLPQAWVPTS